MEEEKGLESNSTPSVDPLATTTNEPESSVMEVTTDSDNKTRKAVQITVNISGVESASLVSSDKNQIVVSGESTNFDQLSFSIGIKIDWAVTTDSGEINTSGGTGMDGSEISSGGGGKSHDLMI